MAIDCDVTLPFIEIDFEGEQVTPTELLPMEADATAHQDDPIAADFLPEFAGYGGGTLAADLLFPSVSAAGDVSVVGALSASMQMPSAEMVRGSALEASVSLPEGALTYSQEINVSVATTFELTECDITAVVGSVSDLSGSFPLVEVASTCSVGTIGDVSDSFELLECDSTAIQSVSGGISVDILFGTFVLSGFMPEVYDITTRLKKTGIKNIRGAVKGYFAISSVGPTDNLMEVSLPLLVAAGTMFITPAASGEGVVPGFWDDDAVWDDDAPWRDSV
jgi:hypothetical protein